MLSNVGLLKRNLRRSPKSYTVSTKRKYTLAAKPSTQNLGGLHKKIQNEAWPSLDQLNGGFGTYPTFQLASLSFEYCTGYTGGDCI